MKRRIITILLAAMALVCMTALVACGADSNPYDDLVGDRYDVRVRFDTSGAVVKGQQEISVVEVYSSDDTVTKNGKTGIQLLALDDPARGNNAIPVSRNDDKYEYFLAGWYTERTPRVNEQGEPLDEFGQLTSVSGRNQGYTYKNKWNFDEDVLEIDPNKTYSTAEEALVLYAAWVPYFNYEFYAVDAGGTATLMGSVQNIDLSLPTWSRDTGKLTMNGIPQQEGMTFEGAYLDAALTQPITADIKGISTFVDMEQGIGTTHTVKVYTTWGEGVWFKIYNAKQFRDNMRMDGHYQLMADLDFNGSVWPSAYAMGVFTGSIEGNGHTIKNVSVIQGNPSQERGGLFGSLGDGASIADLTFENVTYTLQAGSRKGGSAFGLLCGILSGGATVENVQILSSQLLVHDDCYFPVDVESNIGLLCGVGNNPGVDLSGITCAPVNPESTKVTVEVDPVSGRIDLEILS